MLSENISIKDRYMIVCMTKFETQGSHRSSYDQISSNVILRRLSAWSTITIHIYLKIEMIVVTTYYWMR